MQNEGFGRLVLASASPRRRELLGQIGLKPEICPSQIEEIVNSTVPAEVVKALSYQKASDVAERYQVGEEVIVIGADTVVTVDGVIFGKPADAAEAAKMLKLLQGRSHQVFTGVTLIDCRQGTKRCFAEETSVAIFPMTAGEIEAYVASGDPLDKAGGYGIQGIFAAYIEGISGDYNNVVGLPVGAVYQELKKMLKI